MQRVRIIPADELISIREAASKAGVNYYTVRRWAKTGLNGFPKPVMLTSSTMRLFHREFAAWLRMRQEASQAPSTKEAAR